MNLARVAQGQTLDLGKQSSDGRIRKVARALLHRSGAAYAEIGARRTDLRSPKGEAQPDPKPMSPPTMVYSARLPAKSDCASLSRGLPGTIPPGDRPRTPPGDRPRTGGLLEGGGRLGTGPGIWSELWHQRKS